MEATGYGLELLNEGELTTRRLCTLGLCARGGCLFIE
jgi:hypothetical protein